MYSLFSDDSLVNAEKLAKSVTLKMLESMFVSDTGVLRDGNVPCLTVRKVH